MKTKLRLFVGLLMFAAVLTSCSKDNDEPEVNYTVTFNADGGTPAPQSQTVKAGEKATAPTSPTKQGYVFLFWHLSGNTTAYNFASPVTGNITLQAKWEDAATAEYWQVAWELNGGTWPATGDNHATQVVKGGTLAEPTPPTKAGKTFDGWYKEAALTNKINFPYDVSSVTGNITLHAKWSDPAAEYWNITWELNGGAWPSTGDNHVDKVEKGTALAEPAVPIKSGNSFDGWYKEAAFTNKITFPATVTGDFKLFAKWTETSSTSFTISNTTEWNNAVSSIKADGNNKSYTLTIVGNVFVPPTTGVEQGKPSTYTFGAGEKLAVTINGSGTLTLSDKGFLMCLSGKSGAKQKLIIDGPALQGRSDNDVPLLRLDYADLELKAGKITGNTNNGGGGSGFGGGVSINNGWLTMSGGEITNNTCGQKSYVAYGGGASISGGSFIMSGGTISGNTGMYGGGIYLYGYNFTMTGGTIKGNTSKSSSPYGGGVFYRKDKSSVGSFTKTGGIIYGYTSGDANSNRTVHNATNNIEPNHGAAVLHLLGLVIPGDAKRRETTLGENDNLSTDDNAGWGL